MSREAKINIAIIGCGYWGPNFVRNFSQIPNVEVKAVCDTDENKLNHIRHLWRGIKTYNNYHKMLRNAQFDAVVVSTPASTHYRITKDALLKNKHVLVEKPISIKVAEAEELIELSRKIKKILMVGHTFLFNPAVTKIKELLNKYALGKIYYIHSRRTNLGPLRKDVNAIWDLSPHDISIANHVIGCRPYGVSAYAQRFLSHKFEDAGFLILKYPRNILMHIHVSWLDPKKVREMTIIGSKKMLVYDDTNINEPIRIYDKGVMKKKYDKQYNTFEEFQFIIRDGEVKLPKVNMLEPLKAECQHFIDCIKGNARLLTDGENGLAILKVLSAASESINRNGEFIKIT